MLKTILDFILALGRMFFRSRAVKGKNDPQHNPGPDTDCPCGPGYEPDRSGPCRRRSDPDGEGTQTESQAEAEVTPTEAEVEATEPETPTEANIAPDHLLGWVLILTAVGSYLLR